MSSSCTIASVRKGCSSHSALCACNHIQANTELCSLIDTLQKLNILDQPALIGVLLDCISFRKGNCDETLHCKVKPGTLVQEAMLKLRQRSASRVCCLHDLSNSLCAYLCFVGPQFCWFTPESQGGQLACDCELFLTEVPCCSTCRTVQYVIVGLYDQGFFRDFSSLYTWRRHQQQIEGMWSSANCPSCGSMQRRKKTSVDSTVYIQRFVTNRSPMTSEVSTER